MAQLPSPSAFQTYQILAPRDTLIKAACSDVDCPNWKHGWRTLIDESTDLGSVQAHYIRTAARRTYRESRTDAGLTVFTFEAGQRCFTEHRTRPEMFLVHGGNAEINTGLIREHTRPSDWVDDCMEHTDRVVTQRQQG